MSSLADFWAGYISGSIAILIGNPLDVLKVKLQASSPSLTSSPSSSSSSSSSSPSSFPSSSFSLSLPTITSTKTHLRRWIAGTAAPVLGYGALNALLFVSYNRAEEALNGRIFGAGGDVGRGATTAPTTGTNLWATFLAGAVGGLATWVVSTPTELVKCRTQLLACHPSSASPWPPPSPPSSSPSPPAQLSSAPLLSSPGSPSSSSWSVFRATWRAEGLRGLFLGGSITVLRDSIGYGFYFWSYELAWRWWVPLVNATTRAAISADSPALFPGSPTPVVKDSALGVLACGGLAGVISWTSVFPLDVIKTRVQTQALQLAGRPQSAPPAALHTQPSSPEPGNDLAAHPAARQRRPGAWEVAQEAYREGGWRVLFRGWAVCSARAFVVNAVQWAVYEWVMRRLGQESTGTGTRMDGARRAGELMMD